MSTMDSACSFSLSLHRPIEPNSLAEILLSEHNNNLPLHMDVVKLLRLKSKDKEEEQHSNSSSLETLSSIENEQGSGDEAECGSDTSCSEDSFEMSSAIEDPTTDEGSKANRGPKSLYRNRQSRETTCESFTSAGSDCDIDGDTEAQTDADEPTQLGCSSFAPFPLSPPVALPPRSSVSMDSFVTQPSTSRDIASRSVWGNQDVFLLAGLPQFDFAKLEKQLANAAKEQQDAERRLLGEEVRRRLALKFDSSAGPNISASTKPNKSNLAARMQNGMNLQVCYLNDLAESSTAETESESDDDCFMKKSKSAPSLKNACRTAMFRENPEVQRLRDRAKSGGKLDPYERQRLLVGETQRVIRASKIKAESAVDEYRRNRSKASVVPRQSRHYLSKMTTAQIEEIRDLIEDAIARKNIELVQLLMNRDNMCMEHDSLLVDIDDFTEHDAQSDALEFRKFLRMQDGEIKPAEDCKRSFAKQRVSRPSDSASSLPLTSSPLPPSKSKHSAPTPITSPTSPSLSFMPSIPSISIPTIPNSLTNRFSKLLGGGQ
ncbi:hypothetical protein WR25_02767 [Diploscapter pachys]|uniref:Schwannomin interacting protein 1 C-terminal domain-containing protein n=1 Tax=Diploscapter pachys TaxID=2018661 RepID=A0A2A2L5V0_9BILA|nr:hypothetical protein WR25_02767 [Diploscapter pachys]